MSELLLKAENLSLQYNGKTVVKDVSFSLRPGQVSCLLGPSGCGKSSTLRMIVGVEKPHSGSICISGETIFSDTINVSTEERAVGLMFQDFALFPHLNALKNVGFGIKGSRFEKKKRALELLANVGLADKAHHMPHELSGGEQQRVALARAIAPKPSVILMDEPFSGLDDRLREEVRENTLAMLSRENTAVLLVTHDPAEAMSCADEILLMRDGEIVQQGAPFTIYNSPKDQGSAKFLSNINTLRSEVKNSLAETPFGPFLVPGHPDGTVVDIVIRPQHVKIEFDRAGKSPSPTEATGQAAHAKVIRSRFLGRYSLVDFLLDTGETIVTSVPSVFLPKPDTWFWLLAPRKNCYVFPAAD